MDDPVNGEITAGDALSGKPLQHIMIDHCSISCCIDEPHAFYYVEDYTIQWSIMSEKIYNTGHHEGQHGLAWDGGGIGESAHHILWKRNRD